MFKKPTNKLDVVEQCIIPYTPVLFTAVTVDTLFKGTFTDTLVASSATIISYLILALDRQRVK